MEHRDDIIQELEKMQADLAQCGSYRRAGKVDRRGNISISDSEADNESIHISLNHVMEYYLYAMYYKPDAEVVVSDKPYGRYFREYGDLCMSNERFKAAEAAYKDAISWNPTDLDSILVLAECYKHQNMLEKYLIATKEAYRYCCTRATMARYYRNMGFYHTAKYNTGLARACYIYSNIYYHTENADNELKFLEEVLKQETPDMSIEQIQKVFDENDIQPGPESDTIGIIYRVGELMMQDKEYKLARDCFSIVYDITRERELEVLLDELDRI